MGGSYPLVIVLVNEALWTVYHALEDPSIEFRLSVFIAGVR